MVMKVHKASVDSERKTTRPAGRMMLHAEALDTAWRWISALRIEPAVVSGGIAMVPLCAPSASDPGWILLDEALAGGSTRVSEISRAGSVAKLRVQNAGVRDMLLLDGEEVIGAKQNRILNTSILVRAASTVDIPVSCVEQGRWDYRNHSFSTSGNFLYAGVRQKNVAKVSASLRQHLGHVSDQAAIWGDLRLRAALLGLQSPTMADAFTASQADVRPYQLNLRPRPDQVGALVYEGEAWCGMDTLASTELFARAWPRILSGYAMDALWRRPTGQATEDGTERLRAILSASVEMFDAIGAGHDLRLHGAEIAGAALLVDDTVAHLTAFPR